MAGTVEETADFGRKLPEPFAEAGLAVLREAGIEIDSRVGRPRAELVSALAEADGLIVRSETRVDR